MKTTVLLLSALLITLQLNANDFYTQLCKYNFNWKKYEAYVPKCEAKTFATDKEYIQAHLATVLPILEAASTKGLSEKQMQSRQHRSNNRWLAILEPDLS